VKIGAREVGNGAACLVVAEVGMAHDGSLGMAHAYIDAVAKAGAEAVKFQRHRPEDGGSWRLRPAYCQDETRNDYWRRTAFEDDQWRSLAWHAQEVGLIFLCSAFSIESAAALVPLVPAWKIASGQIANTRMVEYMVVSGKPAIISTGMATDHELDEVAARFIHRVILHSTSLYPTPIEQVDLWRIRRLSARYNAPAGLSDHSGTIWPALAAATMGAAMVEVHVTFSREAYGPDTASSITISELAQLCEGIRAIRQAQQPVDREALLKGPLAEARRVYMGVSA
jgi:N,N'-diacetyllegionaminate synthase